MDLLEHIDAIPFLFDHAADAPDLPFNSIQPLLQRFFVNYHTFPDIYPIGVYGIRELFIYTEVESHSRLRAELAMSGASLTMSVQT